MQENNRGILYVVATPIGNLKDISERALEILRNVSLIACEDTRVSKGLLTAYGIDSKLVSYHKFNEESKAPSIINDLMEGRDVAIVTDAGTPCISDPGTVLVRQAHEAGITVVGLPGASAVVTAMSVSGFDGDFAFYGFIPRKKNERADFFDRIDRSGITNHVIYESPMRIVDTMRDLSERFPDAEVSLSNDLTKLYERTVRGSTVEISEYIASHDKAQKGEYVMVLHHLGTQTVKSDVSAEARLVELMLTGISLNEAAESISGDYPRNRLYEAKLNLKKLLR